LIDDGLTLRGLRAGDRPAIASILAAVGVFRPEEIAIGLELVDETVNPGPSTDYRWVVAERLGALVGFACFGPVPLTDATYDLYWLAVAPAEQGRGVASRLEAAAAEAAAAAASGGRWLLAETSSMDGYAAARTFYEKFGYVQVGRIEDFYRVGDHKITYGKRLDRRRGE